MWHASGRGDSDGIEPGRVRAMGRAGSAAREAANDAARAWANARRGASGGVGAPLVPESEGATTSSPIRSRGIPDCPGADPGPRPIHAGMRSPFPERRKVVNQSSRWILPALACVLFAAGVVLFRPLEPVGPPAAGGVVRVSEERGAGPLVFQGRQAVESTPSAAAAVASSGRVEERGTTFYAEVVDALDEPLSDALVELCLPLGSGSRPACLMAARTDADGRCAFDALDVLRAERDLLGDRTAGPGANGYLLQLAGVFDVQPTLALAVLPAGESVVRIAAPLCESVELELSDGQRDLVSGSYLVVARGLHAPGEPTDAPDLRAEFVAGRATLGPVERGQLLELRVHDVDGERLDGPAVFAVADPNTRVRLYLGAAHPRIAAGVLGTDGRPHIGELAVVLRWMELGEERSFTELVQPDASGRFELAVPLGGREERAVKGELFATEPEAGERPLAAFEVELVPGDDAVREVGQVLLGADGWK